VVERHLTPQDIHERYKVLNGAIYGLASHGKFTGAFKPGNRSRHVKGSTSPAGPRTPGRGCRW
jgi:phytoene dehydrogenase-like protein